MENTTKVSVGYEWDIPNHAKNIFTVDSVQGVLRSSESIQLLWTFRPEQKIKYALKLPCKVFSFDDEKNATAPRMTTHQFF